MIFGQDKMYEYSKAVVPFLRVLNPEPNCQKMDNNVKRPGKQSKVHHKKM